MASYFPMIKNSAQRIVFPILDADGDPVTGAADLDSEYSLDGGAFADCDPGEATEIGSSGIYYLDLAAGETNGDVVCIQVKTSTSGAKTTVLVFYTSAQSLDTVDTVVDAIKTAVEHGTYGLSALKDIVEKIDDATDGLTAIKAEVEGLAGAAMRGTDSAALASVLATHDTDIKVYVDLIDDATNGLAAIKAEVEGLGGAAMRGTDNALLAAGYTAPDNAGIATLLTRITAAVALASSLVTHDTEIKALLATIAGYIDTEVATILAAVDTEVGSILTIVNNLPDGGALTALLASIASILTDTDTTIPGLLATIQADLDNPDQYKANVTALALEATLTTIKGVGWTTETLKAIKDAIDAIPAGGDATEAKQDAIEAKLDDGTTGLANLKALLDVIKAVTDALPNGGALNDLAAILTDTDTTIPGLLAVIQADLDNPDQYKANVATLALEATLTTIKGIGWTNETLKLIKELVDELETGEKPRPKARFKV